MLFRRSVVLTNVIANVAGRGLNAALSILAVPVIVRVLGTESYGLVSLFTTFSIIFSFLDLGLSATVNREVARNAAMGRSDQESQVVLRTFEVFYWAIGFAIAGTLLLSSKFIATQYIHAEKLSSELVRTVLTIMALSIAAQWPVSLYSGVLRGLQSQTLQNGIMVGASVLRTGGGLAVVVFVSRTISAFVCWQLVANVIEVTVMAFAAWAALRRNRCANRPRVDPEVVRRLWRYAVSFNVAGTLLMILAQGDRLFIAGSLPLREVGYYSIAGTAAGGVAMITWSMSIALFPRFASLSAANDRETLVTEYHRASQANSFFVVGIVLGVGLFSSDVLRIWTRSEEVTRHASLVLTLLCAASLASGTWNAPYTLLTAVGHTRVPLLTNSCTVLVALAVWTATIPRWGIVAAAATWLAINTAFLCVYHWAAYRVVLREHPGRGLRRDLGGYLVLGLGCIGAARCVCNGIERPSLRLAFLAAGELAYAIAALTMARTRGVFPWSAASAPRVEAAGV